MRKVDDEAELLEVQQIYLNRRIQEANEFLSSLNPYTRIRAYSNIKQSATILDQSRSTSANNLKQFSLNESLLAEAEKKAQEQSAEQTVEQGDNRSRLNSYWAEQGVKRSKNVVSGLKSNFDGVDDAEASKPRGDAAFNKGFFDQNALGTKGEPGADKPGDSAPQTRAPAGEGKPGGRYFRGSGKEAADDAPQKDDFGGQGQNPQLFNDQQRESAQKKLQKEGDEVREGRLDQSKSRDNYSRYGEQLEQNAQKQELFSLNDGGGLAGGGQQVDGRQLAGGPGGMGPGGPQQGASGLMGGMGGGSGAFRGPNAAPGTPPLAFQPGMAPNGDPSVDLSGGVAVGGEDFSAVAAGLASLDFTLPERGQVFNFTTPRGQIEIEARPVAHSLLARLIGLVIVGAVIVVVWLIARQPARDFWRTLFGTVAAGVLLAILGLASIISGIFPLAGLLLLAGGIALAIRNRLNSPVVTVSAS
jgi:hypothetical protein